MADISDLIKMQNALQVASYKLSPADLEGEARIEFIRWNVLALEDELHEALAETGWKPWATSRHVNEDAFKGELIDAFHFFMNLCIVAGMDGIELTERYAAKWAKNAKRQADGYDGVTDKCPSCHRALDDDGTGCAYFTIYADDVPISHRGNCMENGDFNITVPS